VTVLLVSGIKAAVVFLTFVVCLLVFGSLLFLLGLALISWWVDMRD
jgi:hypothetical protein